MYLLCRFILITTIILGIYVLALLAFTIPYGKLVMVVVIFGMMCKKGYRSFSAYGTARWANAQDLEGMIEDGSNGMIVGHVEIKVRKIDGVKALISPDVSARQACDKFLASFQRKPSKRFVRLTRAVHVAAFAPPGAGKSTGLAIPHLLTCRDSMVVIDFKGELLKATAKARRKMGHKVVVLAPFGGTSFKSHTFNPLQFIRRKSPFAIDEARAIAESLVFRTGQEKEPHWNDAAELWISAMISAVVHFTDADKRSLQSVRAILTNPGKINEAIKHMCESDAWDGMLSRLGYQLTYFKDKELGSTLTTTNRHLRFLDTIAVAANTESSSFDPADLLKGKMTVYLVLPPEHMRTQAGLLRLWIGSMLRAVVKGGLQNSTRVHFLCDEAAALGNLPTLEDALDKYRGYGVRLLLLYQSLGQLKKCWGNEGGDQTLLSNVSQIFFGVNDQQTAQYVSDRLGEETLVVQSNGNSSGTSRQTSQQGSNAGYSFNTNENYQQIGRRLLRPEEVTALPDNIAIILTPGVPPFWTTLVKYFQRDFKVRSSIGPLKTVFHTACLFLSVATLAVMFTAGIFRGAFK